MEKLLAMSILSSGPGVNGWLGTSWATKKRSCRGGEQRMLVLIVIVIIFVSGAGKEAAGAWQGGGEAAIRARV